MLFSACILKPINTSIISKIQFKNEDRIKKEFIDSNIINDFEKTNKEIRIKDNIYDTILNKGVYDAINEIIQAVAKRIGPEKLQLIRGKYGILDKNSELYKNGVSYIDGTLNYEGVKEFTPEAFKRYKLQPIEDEAYHIQSKANELYYYLTEMM